MENSADNFLGAERRKFPRLSTAVNVEYCILEEELPKETSVSLNISQGGVCIIMYEQVKANAPVMLTVHLPNTEHSVQVKGRVAWTKEFMIDADPRPRYDTGIEFVEIDEEDRKKLNQYIFSIQQKARQK